MNKRLSLQAKITLLTIVIVFVSLVITSSFIAYVNFSSIKKQTKINIMNVSEIVAQTPFVINSLSQKTGGGEVQEYVKYILDNTEKVDILVVADMNGVRYAHPED